MSNEIDVDTSIYANDAQRFFTYGGYYLNTFTREAARDIERVTRPMPVKGSLEYWPEVTERIKKVIFAILSFPLATLLSIPSTICYTLAACSGKGRWEFIRPKSPFWEKREVREVKVMSVNACLQDPWSPLTGGVVPPFDPIGQQATRVAALVDAIAEENPLVFCGQEFDSIGAQDECIRLLKEKGFSYFLRDMGSNDAIRNPSGLFAASKVPLNNVGFVPYPAEDRAGLAKMSQQGALTWTVTVQGRELRLVDIHLNYGDTEADQAARNRQLKRHVVPLLEKGPTVILGDANFTVSKANRAAAGILGLTNALEGRVTCVDEGKHTLRGKERNPNGQPCPTCEEEIDVVLYDQAKVEVVDVQTKQLRVNGQLITDHVATTATLRLVD